ncbi:hypothetical protein MW887_006013 [Aspergillus wentii]|nr:hypothetical protein MW887_006013 [Aspergillus wentii]
MQFTSTLAVLATLATSALAVPPVAGGEGVGNGVENKGNGDVRFHVPDSVTVKEGQDKCGDQAQLSCCNKATYAGDTTTIDKGLLAGALSNLVGAGSGAEGLGLFDQCSKLPLQVPILAIGLNDVLNQQCKQNIACCQDSGASADGDVIGAALPCVALGSIL